MRKTIDINKGKQLLYQIEITDSFDLLEESLRSLSLQNRKIVIISDHTVSNLYSQEVMNICRKVSKEVLLFSFPAGEENKHLTTVSTLYEFLINNHVERGDMLLALGGGVVGDLTGYAAATYLRGISFIQVPTTLLSQVDSSIGGKTGVDFKQYKNMVGAFHMPKLVYTNIATLTTLEDRQFSSGMAEILKAGLIKDAIFYEWLITNFSEINEHEPNYLIEMIFRSCLIKKAVVEKDPFEKGDRALLNFGHTIGHAIEKEKNFDLYHGECVALGSIAAAYISYKKGYLKAEEYYEIRDMFVPFDLRIMTNNLDCNQVLEHTKNDKKCNEGIIKFILLKKIGRAFIDTSVTKEELLEAINEIYDNEEFYND